MRRLLLAGVLAFICLPLSNGVEIPDVTTIYDVKEISGSALPHYGISGRVHKRTNALGLDLFLNDEKYESQSEEPGWSCDVNTTSECTFTDWSDGLSTHLGLGAPIKAQETVPFSKEIYMKLNFNSARTLFMPWKILLVFTEHNSNIRDQDDFQVMSIDSGSLELTYSYSCYNDPFSQTNDGKLKDRDGRNIYIVCNGKIGPWDIPRKSALKFEKGPYNGNMKIFLDKNDTALMDFDTGREMNYVFLFKEFVDKDDEEKVRVSKPVPVKVSTGLGSVIETPSTLPSSRNMCLTLVLNSSEEIKDKPILRIEAIDLYNVLHAVQDITNLKAGWQVEHVNLEIDSKITAPIKLRVKNVAWFPAELQVRRVSSCSAHGLEVVKLPRNYVSPFSRNTLGTFVATSEALPVIETVTDFPNTCLNGGIMTTSGCACTSGFTGTNCQIGCGENKFGQDCGGTCSFRQRKCEGFLVCSPFVGCTCAPGFSGHNCKTGCSSGQYGNDCGSSCGHCAGGSDCDIYTGECSSCSFGYVPPFCRQEYVYYSLRPKVVSEKYKTITVSFDLRSGVKGVGEPKLYQIQFREKGDTEWKIHTINTVPRRDETESSKEGRKIKETIDALKTGYVYEVRVLLMDASFNKYDGILVETSEQLTKCDIPEEFDYKTTSSSNTSAFTLGWNYELGNENWCPAEVYEVSWMENGEKMTSLTHETSITLTDFVPGFTVDFRVRAKTSGGFAPYSKTVQIMTLHYGTSSVRDLRMVSSQSTVIDVAWRPPIGSEGRPLKYKITFKCVNQVACSPGCKDALEGQLTQQGTSVTLSALQPFTQYLVTVTPENGPQSQLFVGTTEAAPTEAPVLGEQKSVRSNSSITVFWEPVSVCSSFLKGYTYQLTKATESMKLLNSGFIKDTSISFNNLTASTDYVVKVFINTVAGWNPDVFLAINVSTSATVPDAVQNLTVYKRGRTMLGLRWMEPKFLYGYLKSFTVQYSLGKDVISETVLPTRCVVWPEYYCHTLENLKSNRKYNVMVSARNMDMPEDGAIASLTTITKENAPLPPEELMVLNRTSTSVSLQWKHPSLINGVLRSFLVNVEESEKFDQDSCCQDYPLVEIQVKEEKKFYEVEVSGLHPASTYYLSVSAKTVSLGLSQSLIVSTRPPHQEFSTLPAWSSLTEIEDFAGLMEVEWFPQENKSEVNSSDLFSPLVRTHILLAAVNSSRVDRSPLEPGIKDDQLLKLLNDAIPGSFWFMTEYNAEGLGQEESEWGEKPEGIFQEGDEYNLVAVQISDYNGVYNIDLRISSAFVYGV